MSYLLVVVRIGTGSRYVLRYLSNCSAPRVVLKNWWMRLERRSFKISFSFSFTDQLEGPETPVNIVWCGAG